MERQIPPGGWQSPQGAAASAFASRLWESVKLWDNASVSADCANARAEGSSVLGASYVAGGRAAGQAVGVENLYNAGSGYDYAGQKLTAGQRGW